MNFEFIHCGDLHLGCYPNHIDQRFDDFFDAFQRLIDYAITNQIHLVLISGDLFHLKNINSKTLQRTIDLLEIAKENTIEVVAIEGNHDRAFYIDEESWLYFLNNQGYLKLLNSSIDNGKIVFENYVDGSGNTIETDSYKIIGLGYLGGSTDKYISDMKKTLIKSDKFTIIMMHAAVNRLTDQMMGDVKKEVIDNAIKSKVDYIALGHIHNRYEYDDYIYNPGSLENIRLKDGINSNGKGFYHVKVIDGKKEVTFINSNPRVIHFESVNVEGMESPLSVTEHIMNKEYVYKKGEMLDLRLYGKSKFNPYLISNSILDNIVSKYELLYGEFTNHINVQTNNQSIDDTMDVNDIIKSYINTDIKNNYPDVKDSEVISEQMLSIANDILEDDVENLVDKIIKMGVKI